MSTSLASLIAENNPSYSALKNEQVAKTSSELIYGTILRPDDSILESSSARKKGCIPIQIDCLCVQDSPQNPCPCDNRPPIIIWIPLDGILRVSKSKYKRPDGLLSTVLEIAKDTCIYAEVILPMTIENFRKLRQSKKNRGNASSNSGTAILSAPKTANSWVSGVIASFEAGWKVGSWINEETGVSSDIADWLYDTFGEWPW